MMVAVEKWGCNEIRVSLFFHYASFSHISNRSTLLSLQFLGSAFQYSVGGSARQMRAMGQITKSFCFPSRFYTKCGWHALLAASWRFLAQNFAARPRIFTRTVSVFKNRNVMSQRRNDYSSKQIGRK